VTHNLNFSHQQKFKKSQFSPQNCFLTSVLHKILTKICERKKISQIVLTHGRAFTFSGRPAVVGQLSLSSGRNNFSRRKNEFLYHPKLR
jgi:hypothetical protein